jgi:hypothetical protein
MSTEVHRKVRVSAERKRRFVAALRVHGVFREAAREASPGSRHPRGAEQSYRDEMQRDAAFAQAVEEARKEADAAIEREIVRRGIEGFEEQRVDSRGRISVLRRFSDPCLLALARARLPQFRKSDIELSGKVEHDDAGSRLIVEAVRKLADSMAADALPATIAMLAEDA